MGLSAFCFHNWDGLVTWALPAEDHVTSALGAQTKWPPGTHGIRIYNMENVFLPGPHGICPNFEIFFVQIASSKIEEIRVCKIWVYFTVARKLDIGHSFFTFLR